MFNGKIHYKWPFSIAFVCLPEGNWTCFRPGQNESGGDLPRIHQQIWRCWQSLVRPQRMMWGSIWGLRDTCKTSFCTPKFHIKYKNPMGWSFSNEILAVFGVSRFLDEAMTHSVTKAMVSPSSQPFCGNDSAAHDLIIWPNTGERIPKQHPSNQQNLQIFARKSSPDLDSPGRHEVLFFCFPRSRWRCRRTTPWRSLWKIPPDDWPLGCRHLEVDGGVNQSKKNKIWIWPSKMEVWPHE